MTAVLDSIPKQAPVQTLFEQSLHQHLQQDGLWPDVHQAAWERFASIGLPRRRSEPWRNIDLGRVTNTHYQPDTRSLPVISLQNSHLVDLGGPRLVFLNAHYSQSLSSQTVLPEGAILRDLAGLEKHQPGLMRAHWLQALETETEPFALINAARFENGAGVFIPAGVALTQTLQIDFLSSASADQPAVMTHPRCLVIAEAGAKAQIAIQCVGLSEHDYLNNLVVEILAHPQAELDVTLIQHETAQSVHLSSTRITLAENSRVRLTTVAFGTGLARHEIQTRFTGENAVCALNGLSALDGESRTHHYLSVHHHLPQCESHQLYKNVLSDQAVCEFNGTIQVHPQAQKTDASQLNQTLVLSDHARAITQPQLRIEADDVKCSHGATVGQLSEAELFYLASRGIEPERGKSLLTYGFAAEILEAIPDPELCRQLERLSLERLHQDKILV